MIAPHEAAINEQITSTTNQRDASAAAIDAGSKPGKKTTEFWITVVVGVLAQVVTAYGMYKASDPIIAVGGIMTAVAGGAYSMSRGKAKSGGNSAQ